MCESKLRVIATWRSSSIFAMGGRAVNVRCRRTSVPKKFFQIQMTILRVKHSINGWKLARQSGNVTAREQIATGANEDAP